MNQFSVIVTKKDLEKTVAAAKSGNFNICTSCIVWQAVHELFPDEDISVGFYSLTIDEKSYRVIDEQLSQMYKMTNTMTEDFIEGASHLLPLLPMKLTFRLQ